METKTFEGVIYDPSLDSGQLGLRLDDGYYEYDLLPYPEGTRVRVTVEVLIPDIHTFVASVEREKGGR